MTSTRPAVGTPGYIGAALTFIETQFPVSKLSKESYKERKAVAGQTLTGLGKWWGRKPLVLVRATILGLLLPNTGDARRDREIFLKLMTMDEEGLRRRKSKAIALDRILELLRPAEVLRLYGTATPTARQRIEAEARAEAQRLAFARMSYDEKLEYCDRPEQIDGPNEATWAEINTHLGTRARSLPELVRELGERRWGRAPRVGDAFCGGGSIPFEASRIGCEAYGSDLNPAAALLTWAALNVVGGGETVAAEVREAQRAVYDAVDRQVTEWGIEHNEHGWRADAYLYCVEARCPECGVLVPLAPSWVIADKTKVVGILVRHGNQFDVAIRENATTAEMKAAAQGTVRENALHCPGCGGRTPIPMLRGDRRGVAGAVHGLRRWENEDLVPRPDDVFGERLYCVRWLETYRDSGGEHRTRRHYRSVSAEDFDREAKVLELLRQRFLQWQQLGYIPSRRVEPGAKTDEPIRTRGWTHWHHLFAPRQLLVHGLFAEESSRFVGQPGAALTLLVGKLANWNSRIAQWLSSQGGGIGGGKQSFANQALNTLYNFSCRPTLALDSCAVEYEAEVHAGSNTVCVADSRLVESTMDAWITDPPYADAIEYGELSEFFLAWYDKPIQRLFPEWYTDSKRALAVSGVDESFRQAMVDCYRRLVAHMPDDGLQVVMFTHQDAAVWADLALILWSAGLRVSAAWTIATETGPAVGSGNYVQGTVLLVLRKQASDETAFLDEVYPEVEGEVRAQLDAMLALDEGEDPNFGDTDYQLAAYAAALRVLTRYRRIEDLDVQRELSRTRGRGEVSPVVQVIAEAVKIAANHLVPHGFDTFAWQTLTPAERFYLKGLDLESHGELRAGAYQELARGFGLAGYRDLMAATKANENRVKSPTEFRTAMLGGEGFAGSLVRHALFAVREAAAHEDAAQGKAWLRAEVPNYWAERSRLVTILRFMASRGCNLTAWKEADARAAELLAGAVENDSV